MLKIKPDKPLSPSLVTLIRALDQVAMQMSIPYFVIGATARDILIEHVHGLETTRATRDIDFAVAVSSWEEFAGLKEQLIGTGPFRLESNRIASHLAKVTALTLSISCHSTVWNVTVRSAGRLRESLS